MDLFSRKIIAWTLSETLEVSCVIDTINKAKARRNIDQPLIIHSDRGSQYVAKEYKKATENMQSTVIRRKLFRGIMHALNPFILLSNVNGSITLKFATISRHTS